MRVRLAMGFGLAVWLAGGLVAGPGPVCAAQAYTPPPPQLTSLPPCPVDSDGAKKKKKDKPKNCDPTNVPAPAAAPASPATLAPDSAAAKFPYPVATPAGAAADVPAAKKFPYPGNSAPASPPDAPDTTPAQKYPYPSSVSDDGKSVNGTIPPSSATAGQTPDTPSARKFPYPGQTPDTAAAGSGLPDTPNAPENAAPTGSSSSSSSSSAPSDDDPTPTSSAEDDAKPELNDKGSSGRRVLKVLKPQSDSDRVDEDLSVAKFYSQSGNSMAAYLRAKDAVKTQPEFAEAHFILGEAAKKLNKRDEARAELQEYLKLAPDGERAKSAEKALEELR